MKPPPGTKPRSTPTAAATSAWRTSSRPNSAAGKLKSQSKVYLTCRAHRCFKDYSFFSPISTFLAENLFSYGISFTRVHAVSILNVGFTVFLWFYCDARQETCYHYHWYKESFVLPVVTLFSETYHIASVLLLRHYLITVLSSWFQNKAEAVSILFWIHDWSSFSQFYSSLLTYFLLFPTFFLYTPRLQICLSGCLHCPCEGHVGVRALRVFLRLTAWTATAVADIVV